MLVMEGSDDQKDKLKSWLCMLCQLSEILLKAMMLYTPSYENSKFAFKKNYYRA